MPTTSAPSRLRRLAPGLAIIAAATAISYGVNLLVPTVSTLLVAILAGVVLRNVGAVPAAAEPGFAYAAKTILRAGVVLLGFQLSVPVVMDLGWEALVIVAAVVVVTFTATTLIGRAMGMPAGQRLLIATGTSICGAAAVAAMAAVLDRPGPADDEDLDQAAATAVAGVTIYGTIAMFALPALAVVMGLDPHDSGVLVGAAIHEVGQVVAAGGMAGPGVGETAVLAKLSRVLLLAPMVVLVGLSLAHRWRYAVPSTGPRPPLVPAFVLGFVAMVLLRSVLDIPDAAPLPTVVKALSTLLLAAAMVGMGAGVNIATLRRTGGSALLLGLVASLVAAGVAAGGILLLL